MAGKGGSAEQRKGRCAGSIQAGRYRRKAVGKRKSEVGSKGTGRHRHRQAAARCACSMRGVPGKAAAGSSSKVCVQARGSKKHMVNMAGAAHTKAKSWVAGMCAAAASQTARRKCVCCCKAPLSPSR